VNLDGIPNTVCSMRNTCLTGQAIVMSKQLIKELSLRVISICV